MIIVTGQPRCGTSMMTNCFIKQGIPKAFIEREVTKMRHKVKTALRNPEGVFEGEWNGKVGVIKDFKVETFDKYKEPRVVFMDRDVDEMIKSGKDAVEKMKNLTKDEYNFLEVNWNREKSLIIARYRIIKELIKKYNHIIIEYNTFVRTPEVYRKDFEKLFPEINYDELIKGIDKNIYTDRTKLTMEVKK